MYTRVYATARDGRDKRNAVRLIGRQVERAISKGAYEEGVRGTCRSYTRASARDALRVHTVALGYFRGT